MEASSVYHIYNRGNNRGEIFFSRENYLFFLRKIRNHILPHADVLAYCLMPNHFHLLVFTKDCFQATSFSKDIQVMLRSYTRAINNQEGRTGSLFQQNTKFKLLRDPLLCFHYIHQNPLKAGLVQRMEDYEMSSFTDYSGLRKGTLCNHKVARLMLDISDDPTEFFKESYGFPILEELE